MENELLYTKFAHYYDKVYSKKKYTEEVGFINTIIKRNKSNNKNKSTKSILDVACGTGNHAKLLAKKGYSVTGLDKNKRVLQIALRKVPKAKFKQGDMRYFKLNQKFDAVLCMFTAINYNLTMNDLVKTLNNFRRHLKEEGVIIFDAPIRTNGFITAMEIGPGVTVVYDHIFKKNNISPLNIYWIFRNEGEKNETNNRNTTVFKDEHKIRYYTKKEILSATKKSKLKCRIYWDFSLTEKKGKRPVIVCMKK